MIVRFLNTVLLTLPQSITVIMGANIGTTVTVWIISETSLSFRILSMLMIKNMNIRQV